METGGLVSRQKSGSTSDAFSNLPCNVLEEILVRLTIQDAVRTGVLSRKWRYIWTTCLKLEFDDNFCRGSVMRATSDKLMITIYKVLLLHHGQILNFTLSLANLESSCVIDPLIVLVSKNGIREFSLQIRKGEPYKLPSALFSCLRPEHLNLKSCVFKPPHEFKGFTMLLSLELCEVVNSGDVLSSLVSGCPLLERLTFTSSSSFDYLEIVAPKLKYLWCEGLFRSICFRMPRVTDVKVFMEYREQLGFNGGEISNSGMLFCCIPEVESLELEAPYVKCIAPSCVQERLPTILNNLKDLQLHNIYFGEADEVSAVLKLITSSPNLQEIYIRAFHIATADNDPFEELFVLQDWSDVSLNKLRCVAIEGLSDTKVELEFIKLLLAKSSILKTMNIWLTSSEVVEELRIVKEFIGFQRASVHAVITFPR